MTKKYDIVTPADLRRWARQWREMGDSYLNPGHFPTQAEREKKRAEAYEQADENERMADEMERRSEQPSR